MLNIVIDFDSTICAKESLEVLAEIALYNNPNKNEVLTQISEITNKGMNGEISFEESITSRLNLLDLKPSYLAEATIMLEESLSKSFIYHISKFNKYNTYIISGGFKRLIDPIIRKYEIDLRTTYGNHLICKNDKCELDLSSPLCKSKGKVEIVKSLKLKGKTIIIGDGKSDLEIKEEGHADIFIYYNEFVNREKVSAKADYICNNFGEIYRYIESLY